MVVGRAARLESEWAMAVFVDTSSLRLRRFQPAASLPMPMMIRAACLAGLHRNVIVLHGMAQECPPKLGL